MYTLALSSCVETQHDVFIRKFFCQWKMNLFMSIQNRKREKNHSTGRKFCINASPFSTYKHTLTISKEILVPRFCVLTHKKLQATNLLKYLMLYVSKFLPISGNWILLPLMFLTLGCHVASSLQNISFFFKRTGSLPEQCYFITRTGRILFCPPIYCVI